MPKEKGRPLFLAAGGGGDILGAALAAESVLGIPFDEVCVATAVWERLAIDPTPGPRGPEDLFGLERISNSNWKITGDTSLLTGVKIPAARLCRETGISAYLVDVNQGALGVKGQIDELVKVLKPSCLVILDVGGDIIATGPEPGLRSPTLDSIALAVGLTVSVPSEVWAMGLGLDGELSESEITNHLNALDSENGVLGSTVLDPKVGERSLELFRWFPSEASGLTVLSAIGVRGFAEIRSEGICVNLSDASSKIWRFSCETVANRSAIVPAISTTSSLDQIETSLRGMGLVPERDFEIDRSAAWKAPMPPFSASRAVEELVAYSELAQVRGVDFLTLRRVGEILRIRSDDFQSLILELTSSFPNRLAPPIWRTSDPT